VATVKPSGVETLKTLRAAVDLPEFTVGSLAEYAGVSKGTVATVVSNRYNQLFERLGPVQKVEGKSGRPPERWSLRSECIDEVAALAQSLQTSLSAPERAQVSGVSTELRDTLLVSAADALARTSEADPDDVPYLLETVRNSLSSVRAAQEGDTLTEVRTDFIESVAQVVEMAMSKDQIGLDKAQARALVQAAAASQNMPAHEWLPLANIAVRAPSSVMLGPVIVDEAHRPKLLALFPNLVRDPRRATLGKLVRLFDKRSPTPLIHSTDVYLEFIDHDAPAIRHDNVVFVGRQLELFAPVMKHGGEFVLEVDTASTRTEIAKAVNRYALGFE
jgi:hypothetical protein